MGFQPAHSEVRIDFNIFEKLSSSLFTNNKNQIAKNNAIQRYSSEQLKIRSQIEK